MKELITTQLIEEYQEKIKAKTEYLSFQLSDAQKKVIVNDIDNIRIFIRSLQSKQSKERQNIVKTYSDALRTFTGQEKTSMKESEDYFNQTFKQEQK